MWSLIKSVIPSCCFVQVGEGRMKLFPIRGLSRGFHQVPREITKSKTDGYKETRSSWLNCALRDDEAVYWVSIGHYEAVAVGN